jgi:hypothetical protein
MTRPPTEAVSKAVSYFAGLAVQNANTPAAKGYPLNFKRDQSFEIPMERDEYPQTVLAPYDDF